MTTVEGFTWDYDENIDELIIGVDTVDLCSKTCEDDTECRGYTWTNAVVKTCYTFKHELQGYHKCEVCSSGVFSQAVEGACVGEDILNVRPADKVQECRQFCLETDGCEAYTWWDNTSLFINTCFLYGGCETQGECEGCVSGRINCIIPQPDHCVEYMVLDNAYRSVNNSENQSYCDRPSPFPQSSDWQGPGYYRMISPAGSRLPEFPAPYGHCGTPAPGWLRGEHPHDIYAEKDMTVCFNFELNHEDCLYKTSITVTNCDAFFVYMLPDVPDCFMAYCATD